MNAKRKEMLNAKLMHDSYRGKIHSWVLDLRLDFCVQVRVRDKAPVLGCSLEAWGLMDREPK